MHVKLKRVEIKVHDYRHPQFGRHSFITPLAGDTFCRDQDWGISGMPTSYIQSGEIKLYFEEYGRGYPIIFVHEFGSDLRSWEAQVRYFSRAIAALRTTPADIHQAKFQRMQLATAGSARSRILTLSCEGSLYHGPT